MAYNFQPSFQGQQVSNQMPQAPQVQPLFPQPQGNVYNINSTLEVANVPVGAGVSVALCLPENVMYIKTMQNGNPLFYPYRITPIEDQKKENNSANAQQLDKIINKINEMESRLNELSTNKNKTLGEML